MQSLSTNILRLCLCLCLAATPAGAADQDEVRALLKGKIDGVVELLQDKTSDKTVRNERILDIVAPIFDYQAMAKLSLGSKHWPTLSQAQQMEFSTIFIKRLQTSYLDKLDLYTDEEILYGEPRAQGKTVHMPTTMVSRDNRIDMIYKFYRTPLGWKIYDVEIGGVSVIQTYRSQFDGVLSAGTIDDLLGKLKDDGSFTIPEPADKGARPGGQ
jgi:phospholipid transport system substrate-binding protein